MGLRPRDQQKKSSMQAERIGTHSSTTLLTISKGRFSKAKQTGVFTLMQPKVGRG